MTETSGCNSTAFGGRFVAPVFDYSGALGRVKTSLRRCAVLTRPVRSQPSGIYRSDDCVSSAVMIGANAATSPEPSPYIRLRNAAMPKLAKTKPTKPVPPEANAGEGLAQTAIPPQAKVALAQVRVQDFRGLRDLCVALDPLTVLIGENNAGKTSFLQALGIIFGPSRASHDDFYVAADGTRSERFVIDARLMPSTGTEFDDGMRARFKGAAASPGQRKAPQLLRKNLHSCGSSSCATTAKLSLPCGCSKDRDAPSLPPSRR